MVQARLVLLALSFMSSASFAAEPPVSASQPQDSARLHSRPYVVRCSAIVNVWVEVDINSLPAREFSNAEGRKRVQLNLVASAASRGDAVVCNYATRSRDVTTSYSVRCLHPRKERGHRHSYRCQ